MLGYFDDAATARGWFDADTDPEAWFSVELLDAPAVSGGVSVALSGAAVSAPAGAVGYALSQALSATPIAAPAGAVGYALSQALSAIPTAVSVGNISCALAQTISGTATPTFAGAVEYSEAVEVVLAISGEQAFFVVGAVLPELDIFSVGRTVSTISGELTVTTEGPPVVVVPIASYSGARNPHATFSVSVGRQRFWSAR